MRTSVFGCFEQWVVVGISASQCLEVDAMIAEVDFAANESADPFGVHREGSPQERDLACIGGSADVDCYPFERSLEVEFEVARELGPAWCSFDSAG